MSTSHHSDQYQMLANLVDSLADSVRIKILLNLQAEGLTSMTRLSRICGVSSSALQQHLRKLERYQFIKTIQLDNEVYYQLVNPQFARALSKYVAKVKSV